METWFKSILLAASLSGFVSAPFASAQDEANAGDINDLQQVVEPDVERRVIAQDKIDNEVIEIGAFIGFMSIEDFGSQEVSGFSAAYHVNEDVFLEARYGKSQAGLTSYEQLVPNGGFEGIGLLSDELREFTYYNLSAGFNLLPSETFVGRKWAFNSAFYFKAGIGIVKFVGDDHFAINFGAGYRLLLTDWLAWHLDFENIAFDNDITGKEKTTNNLSYNTGFSVFF